jgi:hypothetical protein
LDVLLPRPLLLLQLIWQLALLLLLKAGLRRLELLFLLKLLLLLKAGLRMRPLPGSFTILRDHETSSPIIKPCMMPTAMQQLKPPLRGGGEGEIFMEPPISFLDLGD